MSLIFSLRRSKACLLFALVSSGTVLPASAAVAAEHGRVSSLGALIDSTSAKGARDGLHVLGATPGSTADRLGLRPGDVIVAVNGTPLRALGADETGHALAATTMRRVIDDLPDDATVRLDIERGGSAVTLAAALPAAGSGVQAAHLPNESRVPGDDACGRISAFDVAPRGERLYAARILLLDGKTPGPHGTPSFRVAPGEHRLLVAENIPTEQMGVGEIATFRRQTSKPLTVVVEPGMTAMIAAKFHVQNASDLSHGSYWEPVVWKQIAEPCR